MPPLLADFSHARACKPICEKSLTLPYLHACYDALHTTGHQYMVHDIDEYISARRGA